MTLIRLDNRKVCKYIIVYHDVNGKSHRIDFKNHHSLKSLDDDFKMYAPIYIFKKSSSVDINGNARECKLISTAGVMLVRKIISSKKPITVKNIYNYLQFCTHLIIDKNRLYNTEKQLAIVHFIKSKGYMISIRVSDDNYIIYPILKRLLLYNPFFAKILNVELLDFKATYKYIELDVKGKITKKV